MMIDEVMTETEILAEIIRLTQLLAAGKKPAAPAIRTVKVGDLEWQADVPEQEFTWEEAKAYAASLGDGWRLPKIKELLTLVDYETHNPACSVFPDCPSEWFWSSSPVSGYTTGAWTVYFGYGSTTNFGVSAASRVRCVRSVGGDR
jgi:hypothetical protein